jgi:hypothetical protein
MAWYWWAAGAAVAATAAGWQALRGMGREARLEHARELFRLQRERMEAKFLDAAAATGKPRGLKWIDCEFESKLDLVRDMASGQLLGLVPVTIKFEAVEGGPMEGVEAVGNLRYATAVFVYERGHWVTHGRALFNMHPDEAIRHFGAQFQRV